MDTQNLRSQRSKSVWLGDKAGDFEVFQSLVSVTTQAADWPFADAIECNIPIYDGDLVRREAEAPTDLLSEWNTRVRKWAGYCRHQGRDG